MKLFTTLNSKTTCWCWVFKKSHQFNHISICSHELQVRKHLTAGINIYCDRSMPHKQAVCWKWFCGVQPWWSVAAGFVTFEINKQEDMQSSGKLDIVSPVSGKDKSVVLKFCWLVSLFYCPLKFCRYRPNIIPWEKYLLQLVRMKSDQAEMLTFLSFLRQILSII